MSPWGLGRQLVLGFSSCFRASAHIFLLCSTSSCHQGFSSDLEVSDLLCSARIKCCSVRFGLRMRMSSTCEMQYTSIHDMLSDVSVFKFACPTLCRPARIFDNPLRLFFAIFVDIGHSRALHRSLHLVSKTHCRGQTLSLRSGCTFTHLTKRALAMSGFVHRTVGQTNAR